MNCLDERVVPEEIKSELLALGRDVLREIAEGRADAIFELMHPIAQDRLGGDGLNARFDDLKPLIKDPQSATLADVQVITIRGTLNATALCGPADMKDPEHRLIWLQEATGRVALVTLEMDDANVSHNAVVQFREVEDAWRLWAINIGVHEVNGNDADYFEEKGKSSLADGRLTPAYLFCGLSHSLHTPAPYIKTGGTNRLAECLEAIGADPEWTAISSPWSMNGQSFEVAALGVHFTLDSVLVEIRHVTDIELTEKATWPAAEAFREHIATEFPELASEFDGLLISSFNEKPVDPRRQYATYRHVLSFENSGAVASDEGHEAAGP